MRFVQPDLSLMEEVTQFDHEWLAKLAGDAMSFQHTKMAPLDVGIPCTGARLWLVGNKSSLGGVGHSVRFDTQTLLQTVCRTLECDACIWLLAEQSEVDAAMDSVNASGAKLPLHPRGKRYRPEDCLSDGYANRLHLHRLRGAAMREAVPHLRDVDFYYDISQNPDHTKRPDGLLPRQLTSSFVWAEKLNRPMLRREMWAGQGVRIICLCSVGCAEYL